MAKKLIAPRKQRTRQHVIADLSAHCVEGFVLAAGHTVQRLGQDYGYELFLTTYDERGYIEPGILFIQLKAAETLRRVRTNYVFDLDIRDYNLWLLEERPVILIQYDANRRRAYWLPIQRYFEREPARRPKKGAKTVRVRVPKSQRVNTAAVARMRELKRGFKLRLVGGQS